jgi:hypothetical protein
MKPPRRRPSRKRKQTTSPRGNADSRACAGVAVNARSTTAADARRAAPRSARRSKPTGCRPVATRLFSRTCLSVPSRIDAEPGLTHHAWPIRPPRVTPAAATMRPRVATLSRAQGGRRRWQRLGGLWRGWVRRGFTGSSWSLGPTRFHQSIHTPTAQAGKTGNSPFPHNPAPFFPLAARLLHAHVFKAIGQVRPRSVGSARPTQAHDRAPAGPCRRAQSFARRCPQPRFHPSPRRNPHD